MKKVILSLAIVMSVLCSCSGNPFSGTNSGHDSDSIASDSLHGERIGSQLAQQKQELLRLWKQYISYEDAPEVPETFALYDVDGDGKSEIFLNAENDCLMLGDAYGALNYIGWTYFPNLEQRGHTLVNCSEDGSMYYEIVNSSIGTSFRETVDYDPETDTETVNYFIPGPDEHPVNSSDALKFINSLPEDFTRLDFLEWKQWSELM